MVMYVAVVDVTRLRGSSSNGGGGASAVVGGVAESVTALGQVVSNLTPKITTTNFTPPNNTLSNITN